MLKSIHSPINRIAISTVVAIATVVGSATISRGQLYNSVAACHVAGSNLVRAGAARGYTCTPITSVTGIGNIRNLQGKSLNWIKKQKPRGWRTVSNDNRGGWKWLDENGIERLRFTRPNGKTASASRWSRESIGYIAVLIDL